MDQRLFIVNELQRVAGEVAPESIRKENFIRLSGIPESQLRKHFRGSDGPWKAALKEAGVEVSPSQRPLLSEDELMDAIGKLWKELGHQPTGDDMRYSGTFSEKPYRDRWGKFRESLKKPGSDISRLFTSPVATGFLKCQITAKGTCSEVP